jgi:hypothetical protein
VANDLEQWISICPGVFTPNKIDARNGTTGNCAQDGSNSVLFLINWETNTNAFSTGKDQKGNSTIAAGSTTPHWFYGNTQFGYPILNLATIDLNNTKTFNDAFVFTTCPQHCTIIKPQKPASLCEVILHELGHAFGLDDLRSKASGGQNYPWGVMWGELDDGQLGCPDKQLQDIDQCYFCKLYCPDFGACQSLSAPLPVGDTSMSIAVFPNPATSSFTIVYKTQSEHPRLLIEDINGRTIKKENLSGNAGSLDVKRDQLPAGAYILKLQAGSYFIVRLLILQ